MLLETGNSFRSLQMRVMVRPVVSSDPPAVDGTITSTFRCGLQPCAAAPPALATAIAAISATALHPVLPMTPLLASGYAAPGRGLQFAFMLMRACSACSGVIESI